MGSIWEQLKTMARINLEIDGDLNSLIILRDNDRWAHLPLVKKLKVLRRNRINFTNSTMEDIPNCSPKSRLTLRRLERVSIRSSGFQWQLMIGRTQLSPFRSGVMPFTKFYEPRIPPTGWDIMQIAHNKASDILARDPKTHEFADRLARDIIRLYESGERDPVMMAFRAAEIEINTTHLARRGATA